MERCLDGEALSVPVWAVLAECCGRAVRRIVRFSVFVYVKTKRSFNFDEELKLVWTFPTNLITRNVKSVDAVLSGFV